MYFHPSELLVNDFLLLNSPSYGNHGNKNNYLCKFLPFKTVIKKTQRARDCIILFSLAEMLNDENKYLHSTEKLQFTVQQAFHLGIVLGVGVGVLI